MNEYIYPCKEFREADDEASVELMIDDVVYDYAFPVIILPRIKNHKSQIQSENS